MAFLLASCFLTAIWASPLAYKDEDSDDTVFSTLDNVETDFTVTATIRNGNYGVVQLNGAHEVFRRYGGSSLQPFLTHVALGVTVYNFPAGGFLPGALFSEPLRPAPSYSMDGRNVVTDPGLRVVVKLPSSNYPGSSGLDIVGSLEAVRYKFALGADNAESNTSAVANITVRNHLEAVVAVLVGEMNHVQTYELQIRDYSNLDNAGQPRTDTQANAAVRVLALPRFGTIGKPGGANYTQAQVDAGLRWTGDGYATPSIDNRLFTYRPPLNWAGNDSFVFAGFIVGFGWESAPAEVVLHVPPVTLAPQLRMVFYEIIVSVDNTAPFALEIVVPSEPYDDPKKLYWLTVEVFPTFAVTCEQAARLPFNTGDDGASWGSQSGIDGVRDSPKMIALGTLAQLRHLVADPTVVGSNHLSRPWISSPAIQNAK